MAELWDSQIAQAADGNLWTDKGLLQNWGAATTVTGAQVITCTTVTSTTPNYRLWQVVGTSDVESRTLSGHSWSTPGTIAALPSSVLCGLVNGQTVLYGGDPGGASAAKIARSTTGNNPGTFAAVTSVDATTATVRCLALFNGLYVAGMSNGNIETSPDGVTWTNRTVPDSRSRSFFAQNSTSLLAVTSASTDRYIRSTTGTTWTIEVLPATSTTWAVAWNSQLELFMVVNAAGQVWTSPDGLAPWTSRGTFVLLGTTPRLLAFGRLFVVSSGGAIYASADSGATWEAMVDFGASVTINHMFYESGQLAVVLSSGAIRLSHRVA